MTITELSTIVGMDSPIQSLIKELPVKCSTCGADLVINKYLTQLSCSNSSCIGKLTKQGMQILKNNRVRAVSEEDLKKYLSSINAQFSSDTYKLLYDDVLGIHLDLTMSFVTYIERLSIPFVSHFSCNLFSYVNSLTDFYTQLEAKGLEYVQELLNVDVEAPVVSNTALKVYDYLVSEKANIINGLQYVNIC